MLPKNIDGKTSFQKHGMPDLGLVDDPLLRYRIYCLRCTGDRYYVGLSSQDGLHDRLVKHWEKKACDFTTQFPPLEVVLVRPCQNRAAEAFLYYAMLEKLSGASVASKIGGWTQTSARPSPLTCLIVKEAKRSVEGKCFICGGGSHQAGDCPRKAERDTCYYQCKGKGCSKRLYLTSRGQTPDEGHVSQAGATRGEPRPETASQPEPQRGATAKRKAESIAQTPAKHAKISRAATCRRVKICGHGYTTLAWFLGVDKPSKSQCAVASNGCLRRAVQLQHGDAKTLVAQDFARCTGGRELLPGRVHLPSGWVASSCFPVRVSRSGISEATQAVEIRKARADGTSRCRGVLFRVLDLRDAFA